MIEPLSHDYHDISATEFKKRFGKTLDDAAHGQPVRVIRHGRRDQFDDMVARIQTSKARKATASIGTVKPATLGKAAQRGTRRSRMAAAILDRLLQHASTVNIKGESYRLKEKRKAGLLGKSKPRTESKEAVTN